MPARMNTLSPVCLFCRLSKQTHHTARSAWHMPRVSGVRPASSLQRRRQPGRMHLAKDVDRAGPSRRDTPRKTSPPPWLGPHGGMNRTAVNLERTAPPRSQAATRRTNWNRGKEAPDEAGSKRSHGHDKTFHALKMQQSLNVISYEQRSRIRARLQAIESFDQFKLLPAVQEAVSEQALAQLEEVTPTPIQKLAIPALLKAQRTIENTRDTDKIPMKQFLLAAETGSGKTLAYLLPILDAIKTAENAEKEADERRKAEVARRLAADPTYVEPPQISNQHTSHAGQPRAIILLPSAELVTQVWSVVRSLAYRVKIRSEGISATVPAHVIRRRIFETKGIDVLIATPHILAAIRRSEPSILNSVRHLVVDEADSLMDRSFSPTTTEIIDRVSSNLHQLIMCSATIPRTLDSTLRTRYPDMQRLTTPGLHAVPRRVVLSTIDVDEPRFRGNRDLACADAIWTIAKASHDATDPDGTRNPERKAGKRILVFVNEREKAPELAAFLQSKGIKATALYRDTPDNRRTGILSNFTVPMAKGSSTPITGQPATLPISKDSTTSDGSESTSTNESTTANESAAANETEDSSASNNPPPPQSSSLEAPSSRTSSSETLPANIAKAQSTFLADSQVLVATDLASRGIDTLAVRHVILYDVPYTTIDFIHRLGRVGRMKQRGRGIVLVGKKDRKDIVREVREGMFRGQALI